MTEINLNIEVLDCWVEDRGLELMKVFIMMKINDEIYLNSWDVEGNKI